MDFSPDHLAGLRAALAAWYNGEPGELQDSAEFQRDMDAAIKAYLAQTGTKIVPAAPTSSTEEVEAEDSAKAFAEWLNAGPGIAKAAAIELEISAITAHGNTIKLTTAGFPAATVSHKDPAASADQVPE